MDRKYKLIMGDYIEGPNERRLYRIQALKDFGDVKKGDLGGYIQKEKNLSHGGAAWVYDTALVYGGAHICDNAKVSESACVFGTARIYDDACVYDNAKVNGHAKICGFAEIGGTAQIFDNVKVCGNALINGDTIVFGNAQISYNAKIHKHYEYISMDMGFYIGNITAFMTRDNEIGINHTNMGFNGRLSEFCKYVKNARTRKFAKEYLLIAKCIKYHFNHIVKEYEKSNN